MAATSEALWDVLYAWITLVLPGVMVIESHQNAPTPNGNFISVDYAGTWHFAGTMASKRISSEPELVSPRVYVYRGSVQVRDVDGSGDNLMELVESLERTDVLRLFENAGASVLKSEGPSLMPALQQTRWRRESILTLEMTWARAHRGTTEAIHSVEVNGSEIEVENS